MRLLELRRRLCTPVNEGFAVVRTVIFRAFSGEIGLAEVDNDIGYRAPARRLSPELDERYVDPPPEILVGTAEKTGSISNETLPVLAKLYSCNSSGKPSGSLKKVNFLFV